MRQSTSLRYKQPAVAPNVLLQETLCNSNLNPSVTKRPPTPSTSVAQGTLPLAAHNNKSTYASILRAKPTTCEAEELFTAEELVNLTLELVTNLAKCKTKGEQFQVVSNLAFKFVYPHHGP